MPPDSNPAPPRLSRDDIARMRRQYQQGGLSRADLAEDPIAQFERWFAQACEAGVIEPNAMSLATASAEGQVTARTVLLKGVDERGFVFFTNLESAKARHIEANPQVSLLFPWLLLERQVIVLGRAAPLGKAEVLKYFLTRPYGSQLAAWASPQSRIVESRRFLEQKLAEMQLKFSEGKVPLPSFWGGFRVAPISIEFWQGRPNRMHDRFRYVRQNNAWHLNRLGP